MAFAGNPLIERPLNDHYASVLPRSLNARLEQVNLSGLRRDSNSNHASRVHALAYILGRGWQPSLLSRLLLPGLQLRPPRPLKRPDLSAGGCRHGALHWSRDRWFRCRYWLRFLPGFCPSRPLRLRHSTARNCGDNSGRCRDDSCWLVGCPGCSRTVQ